MSSFTSFLEKYSGEALSIATALNSILSGVALPKAESDQVQAVIDKLTAAQASIEAALANGTATDMPDVKISETDIMAVCKPYIDSMVNNAIAAALEAQKPVTPIEPTAPVEQPAAGSAA